MIARELSLPLIKDAQECWPRETGKLALSVNTGELALPLFCLSVARASERYLPTLIPCTYNRQKSWSYPLIGCSNRGSRSFILGNVIEIVLGGRVSGDLPWGVSIGEGPCNFSTVW